MNLRQYFHTTPGRGILATAGKDGAVDMAIYSGPYFKDDTTLGFIMAEHLTYDNIKANPRACFMYIESGGWFSGKRVYLTKVSEGRGKKLITDVCEHCNYSFHGNIDTAHVVFFKVDKVRPLVGGA